MPEIDEAGYGSSMMRFGYTLMGEQSAPRDLVRYAARAEEVGFDFEVISDHYFPWLESQGHSPYAWSVLGAVSQVTDRVDLMTYVTCPTRRYHPAVVAQKAATVSLLSEGRFRLGLGAGENLNEHVVGPWPQPAQRQDMLAEAIQVIAKLLAGKQVTFDGEYFRVDAARLWDLPDARVPIAAAVSGDRGIAYFAGLVDDLVAVEPSKTMVDAWDAARGGADSRKIGQLPICWAQDAAEAERIAHDQFRWFGSGWKVNAELPGPDGFAGATQFVRPEDVSSAIACGPDLDQVVEKARAYADAGFTDLALLQIGDGSQEFFLNSVGAELLKLLREELG